MKTIKVQKLTEAAFAPFGKVLTSEGLTPGGNPASHLWFPQVVVIDDPTSVNLMTVKEHPFVIKDFEAHDHTVENLLPLDGDLIVAFAPAGALKAENVAAFYIPQGLGICADPKVWHAVPFAVGKDVRSIVVFKNNTSNEDIYFSSLDEEYGVEL